MKQETLEEAALRLYPIILKDGWDKNKHYRDKWIECAKWKEEHIPSQPSLPKVEMKLQLSEVVEEAKRVARGRYCYTDELKDYNQDIYTGFIAAVQWLQSRLKSTYNETRNT